MHIRVFQQPFEARQNRAEIVVTGLDVDEQQGIGFFGPAVDLIHDSVGHDHAVLSRFARFTLGNNGNQMQSRLYRCCRIGFFPARNFSLQAAQHVVLGKFTQGAHAFGEWIAVIGDNALFGQKCAGQRCRDLYGPPFQLGKLRILARIIFDLNRRYRGRCCGGECSGRRFGRGHRSLGSC